MRHAVSKEQQLICITNVHVNKSYKLKSVTFYRLFDGCCYLAFSHFLSLSCSFFHPRSAVAVAVLLSKSISWCRCRSLAVPFSLCFCHLIEMSDAWGNKSYFILNTFLDNFNQNDWWKLRNAIRWPERMPQRWKGIYSIDLKHTENVEKISYT